MTNAAKHKKSNGQACEIGKEHLYLDDKPVIPKAMDVPTLVSQYVAKNIAVTKGGKTSHMPRGEAQVEKMFYDAISGDAAVAKQLVRWAIKYIPPFKMPKADGEFLTQWLTDDDVKGWKEMGCLPPDVPDDITKISASKLNKAHNKMKSLTKDDWDAYYDKHPELLDDLKKFKTDS